MSDAKERVRELLRSMGLEIPEDRLEQVAASWEATRAEIEVVRVEPSAHPSAEKYDPAWSEKR